MNLYLLLEDYAKVYAKNLIDKIQNTGVIFSEEER
jgi:hypothetical protein